MVKAPIYFCVYRITNIIEKKHYYGYKSSNIHPSKVIGVTYFSSMRNKDGATFKKDQKENPQNFKYKILQIFNNKDDALNREIKMHSIFDVENNPNFYNKRNQRSSGYDTTGYKHTNKTKANMSAAQKGKPKSEEHKANMSLAHKKFIYVSPIGTVNDSRGLEPIIPASALNSWCSNPDKIINKMSYYCSKYLRENYKIDIIGKTYRELGFYKINKSTIVI